MSSHHARSYFDYLAPENLETALHVLRKNHGAAIIAGGTDLLPRWRSGFITAGTLIDLRLLNLGYIRRETNHLHIGAYTTHSEMIGSRLLNEHYPALTAACRQIAGPPIRNRGTLGGNLINASPAADTAPPLLVYDAEVVLIKAGSQRIVPLEEFFIGPGETTRKPDELLAEVRLPINHAEAASKFLKLGNRQAMSIAVASVAVQISLGENDEVLKVHIAMGSVAPTPIRARLSESMLLGKPLSEEMISLAAYTAQKEASPITDLRASKEYRTRMVEVLVRRALEAVWMELKGRKPVG